MELFGEDDFFSFQSQPDPAVHGDVLSLLTSQSAGPTDVDLSDFGNVLIDGQGNDYLYGVYGEETLYEDTLENKDSIEGVERFYESAGSDQLYAESSSEALYSGFGSDELFADYQPEHNLVNDDLGTSALYGNSYYGEGLTVVTGSAGTEGIYNFDLPDSRMDISDFLSDSTSNSIQKAIDDFVHSSDGQFIKDIGLESAFRDYVKPVDAQNGSMSHSGFDISDQFMAHAIMDTNTEYSQLVID